MVGELLRNELLEKKFSPHSLECLMAAIDGAVRSKYVLSEKVLFKKNHDPFVLRASLVELNC